MKRNVYIATPVSAHAEWTPKRSATKNAFIAENAFRIVPMMLSAMGKDSKLFVPLGISH